MTGFTLPRRAALALPLALAVQGASVARVAAAPEALDEPLGIGLEGWPYPGPVRYLPLSMSGQAVRMAYMDLAPLGPSRGQTVVLLHGKNFDSSYWAGPIGWLRSAGFRVVVPDQVGFNKSAKPDLDYTFEALASNTLALLDALGVGPTVVLGHSTGGALAVRLASMAGERVTRLVLEDPIGLVDVRAFVPPQDTATLVAAEHAFTADSYRAFMAHFFARLPPEAWEPFVTWRMRVALSPEFDRFARASALLYQMIYREPVRGLYADLSMPVLLLAGTQDRSAPLAGYATPEARARMPNIPQAAGQAVHELRAGRLVTFAGVGHVPHLEDADRFRDVVLDFLSA